MNGLPTLTVAGNLTDAPELRYLPDGTAICRFRIASTPRSLDRSSGEWTDGKAQFFTCQAWRDLAENVAESVQKGQRVIVHGRLRQRTYETDGERRTAWEIEVEDIGASMRWAVVKSTPARKAGAAGSADRS